MWLNEHAPIRKQDLALSIPYVNSAGMLGFAPNPHAAPCLTKLGAFITSPISRLPHSPAANRCCLPFPGGFLLHTGLQNPGISRGVARYKRRWGGAPLPMIVHLLVETPESLAEMVRKLEGLENVLAVELGLPPNCDPEALPKLLNSASGELPVIVSLAPEQVPVLIETLKELQPAAVHLHQPQGMLPGPDGEIISGRLYGPATFPVMLQGAKTLVGAGLRVVSDGGITDQWQAAALFNAGVTAVGLGAVLWQVDQSHIFIEA